MGFLTTNEIRISESIVDFDMSKEKIDSIYKEFCKISKESYTIERSYKQNVSNFLNVLFNSFRTTFIKKEILKSKSNDLENLFTFKDNNITYYFSSYKRKVHLKGLLFKKDEVEYYISHGQLLELKNNSNISCYNLINDSVSNFKLVSILDKELFTREKENSYIKYCFNGKIIINKEANENNVLGVKYSYFNKKKSVYINLDKTMNVSNENFKNYLYGFNILDISIDEKHNDYFVNFCLDCNNYENSFNLSKNILEQTYLIKTNEKDLNEQIELLNINCII